ncbi:MAG: hypothetical protein LQ350_003886 [Teloschistes chrysophthalmus]|nr:MAG: hypothetical protein LQ350_003886 [Niorma chrysophthalma]
MVNTRGQRPAGPAIQPALAQDESSLPVELDATTTAGDAAAIQANAPTGRLLKRRRSVSQNFDPATEPAQKRPKLRKAPSPVARRATTLGSNAAHRGLHTNNQDAVITPLPVSETLTGIVLGPGSDTLQHSNGANGEPSREDGTVDPHPDMHAVINRIINHGENVDSQYGTHDDRTILKSGIPNGALGLGANSRFQIQSLPVLENLALQLLATFASTPYQQLLILTSNSHTEPGATYAALKSLFDHTKKVYSIREPFLSARELGLSQADHIDTIRKANIATFVSGVFGSQDVGFYHLNEFFLDSFVGDSGRLLKHQAGLFLDLKTQAYISAITNGERSREEILDDLFPVDLEQRLLDRRSGAKQLASGEVEFLQRASNRKKALLEEPLTPAGIARLPEKYVWEHFLRDTSASISKSPSLARGSPVSLECFLQEHMTERVLTNPKPSNVPTQPRSTNIFEAEVSPQPKRQSLRKPPQAKPPKEPEPPPPPPVVNNIHTRVAQMVPTDTDDIAAKAARAAEFAMQDFSVAQEPVDPSQSQRSDQDRPQQQQYPFQFEQQPAPYYTQQDQFNNNTQHIPSEQQQPSQPQQQANQQRQRQHPQTPQQPPPQPRPTPTPTPTQTQTQTAPTSLLYERARLAATAKTTTLTPTGRRAGLPSARRPWTNLEEEALMSGLDAVKGPHWSQILAMHGAGGSVSENLKDRNQVQLKDKARNLKLFFLKSGVEVPFYLGFVTGELKTRAPGVVVLGDADGDADAQAEPGADSNAAVEGRLADVESGREQGEGAMEMEDGEGEIIDPAEYAAVHNTIPPPPPIPPPASTDPPHSTAAAAS